MTIEQEMKTEQTALTQLLSEFPQLADWPRGDLMDMLGSVSPRMSTENGAIQARYKQLIASPPGV